MKLPLRPFRAVDLQNIERGRIFGYDPTSQWIHDIESLMIRAVLEGRSCVPNIGLRLTFTTEQVQEIVDHFEGRGFQVLCRPSVNTNVRSILDINWGLT